MANMKNRLAPGGKRRAAKVQPRAVLAPMIDPTAPRAAQVAALDAIFKYRQRWRHIPTGRVARVTDINPSHMIVILRFEDGKNIEGQPTTYETVFIDPRALSAEYVKSRYAKTRVCGSDLWERVL